ncbi:hypothetical protein AMELA_G00041700, partial [Ameiurus melas]
MNGAFHVFGLFSTRMIWSGGSISGATALSAPDACRPCQANVFTSLYAPAEKPQRASRADQDKLDVFLQCHTERFLKRLLSLSLS